MLLNGNWLANRAKNKKQGIMKKQAVAILLKIIFTGWILIVVLTNLIISGANEFKLFVNYYFPNFVNFINSWLVPLLSAPYQG